MFHRFSIVSPFIYERIKNRRERKTDSVEKLPRLALSNFVTLCIINRSFICARGSRSRKKVWPITCMHACMDACSSGRPFSYCYLLSFILCKNSLLLLSIVHFAGTRRIRGAASHVLLVLVRTNRVETSFFTIITLLL